MSETYNPYSFRNALSDNPIDGIPNEPQYQYLHSTALSTYCGNYKEYQIKQGKIANEFIENMANAYQTTESVKSKIDAWEHENNQLIRNLGEAIKLKVANPNLYFQEDYCIDKFQAITDELVIFGLSPYNDYHLFEMINRAPLIKCLFYYYDESECDRVKRLLPNVNAEMRLEFKNVKSFWEGL